MVVSSALIFQLIFLTYGLIIVAQKSQWAF